MHYFRELHLGHGLVQLVDYQHRLGKHQAAPKQLRPGGWGIGFEFEACSPRRLRGATQKSEVIRAEVKKACKRLGWKTYIQPEFSKLGKCPVLLTGMQSLPLQW